METPRRHLPKEAVLFVVSALLSKAGLGENRLRNSSQEGGAILR